MLVCSHVKHGWWCLTWIINDVVVDVVIVDDVCNVASTLGLAFDSLLRSRIQI